MAKAGDIKIDFDTEGFTRAVEGMRRHIALWGVSVEAIQEMQAQDVKWGVQHHRDGTGKGVGRDVVLALRQGSMDRKFSAAEVAKSITDNAEEQGTQTWEKILTEEFFEALEEDDPAKLRAELIQIAAVALNWVTDIDSREA